MCFFFVFIRLVCLCFFFSCNAFFVTFNVREEIQASSTSVLHYYGCILHGGYMESLDFIVLIFYCSRFEKVKRDVGESRSLSCGLLFLWFYMYRYAAVVGMIVHIRLLFDSLFCGH